MQYTNLGKTGLKVSRLCLGMMTYGTPKWRPWVLDEAASRPLVRAGGVEASLPIPRAAPPTTRSAGSPNGDPT